MSSGNLLSILILVTSAPLAASHLAHSQTQARLSCNQATPAKPDAGVAYSGKVLIDDYKLHARVPEGFTGWGGVANDAPFHGFTIFLDRSLGSCIVFEVHLRIDEDEARVRPRGAGRFLLGNATAWQTSNGNHGQGPINITTYFSSQQKSRVVDGKVLLISPPGELQKMKSVYDTFLNSLALGTR